LATFVLVLANRNRLSVGIAPTPPISVQWDCQLGRGYKQVRTLAVKFEVFYFEQAFLFYYLYNA